jgi:hypothetical protein
VRHQLVKQHDLCESCVWCACASMTAVGSSKHPRRSLFAFPLDFPLAEGPRHSIATVRPPTSSFHLLPPVSRAPPRCVLDSAGTKVARRATALRAGGPLLVSAVEQRGRRTTRTESRGSEGEKGTARVFLVSLSFVSLASPLCGRGRGPALAAR